MRRHVTRRNTLRRERLHLEGHSCSEDGTLTRLETPSLLHSNFGDSLQRFPLRSYQPFLHCLFVHGIGCTQRPWYPTVCYDDDDEINTSKRKYIRW